MGTAHPLFWGAAKDGRDGNTGGKGEETREGAMLSRPPKRRMIVSA